MVCKKSIGTYHTKEQAIAAIQNHNENSLTGNENAVLRLLEKTMESKTITSNEAIFSLK